MASERSGIQISDPKLLAAVNPSFRPHLVASNCGRKATPNHIAQLRFIFTSRYSLPIVGWRIIMIIIIIVIICGYKMQQNENRNPKNIRRKSGTRQRHRCNSVARQ